MVITAASAMRARLETDRHRLGQWLMEYIRCQADQWRLVPWHALLALENGYPVRAYRQAIADGYWLIEKRLGVLREMPPIYLQLERLSLVYAPRSTPLFLDDEPELLAEAALLLLAADLDALDAGKIIARLQQEALQPRVTGRSIVEVELDRWQAVRTYGIAIPPGIIVPDREVQV